MIDGLAALTHGANGAMVLLLHDAHQPFAIGLDVGGDQIERTVVVAVHQGTANCFVFGQRLGRVGQRLALRGLEDGDGERHLSVSRQGEATTKTFSILCQR